jgi:hypothetical protein
MASAIWLRAELPLHKNKTLVFSTTPSKAFFTL